MTRIRWTNPAVADLTAISDFIALDSPDAALRVARKIYRGIETLKDFPNRGRPGRVQNTRELVFAGLPYLAIYEVSGETIIIQRVLHGAMRWPA